MTAAGAPSCESSAQLCALPIQLALLDQLDWLDQRGARLSESALVGPDRARAGVMLRRRRFSWRDKQAAHLPNVIDL